MVLWRPTRPLRTNAPKRCPFHYRGLECKSRKSRNTGSTRQIWPWSTEWSRAKPIEFCQENALVIANTLFQQHKRRLYTWTSPDGQHRNQIDYILCSQRWRSSIQSDFSVDHLAMSMCRVFSCVVERGCLLWTVHFLGKTLLVFALLHSVFQGQIYLLFQMFLDFLLLHSSPL